MSSQINTGTMKVNYPLPGVNNSSQGFRDNFASISVNFEAAKSEIDEILSKAIFKSPVTGSTLANDLNNNIISNAQTLGFRSSTYNLGSNLSGTVTVDLTYGDVQYGDVTGDISLQFAKWAPNETYSSVQLILNVSAGQKINLPITATTGVLYGTETIEGFDSVTNNIVVPSGVTRLHFQFSTLDCGTTIEISPIDRPRKSSQVKTSPAPTTANVTLTGTITSVGAVVTGVGTLFTTEAVSGRILTDSTGTVIGTVLSVTSNVSLTLVAAPATPVTGITFKGQNVPIGNPGDVSGDIRMDGSFLYVCTATYNGTTAIWKRTALSAY